MRRIANNQPAAAQRRGTLGAQRLELRHGSLLLEVIVGAALLATLMVLINQMVVRLHAQTATIDRHYVAQQTLENLLEDLSSRNWADLESAAIKQLEVPALASAKLPGVRLDGEVWQEVDPNTAKRITLRIAWQDRTHSEPQLPDSTAWPLTSRTLTTWVYQHVGDQP